MKVIKKTIQKMQTASIPPNESARLTALHGLFVLDTLPAPRFERIGRIAQALFHVPIAITSLIDADRQWFKSHVGLDVDETSRDISLCAYTILQDQVFIVHDTFADVRFSDNPLVIGPPYIRFYAGVPLISADGHHVGAFAIIDTVPRTLDAEQSERLRELADIVSDELAREKLNEVTALYDREKDLLHEAKNLLQLVAENAPGMLGYWNADLRCAFANKAYVDWFGREPEQIIDMPMEQLLGQEVFALNTPFINGALAGQDQQFERTLIKPSGEVGYTLARYIPHRAEDKVVGFFVQVSDITVVKLAYKQLQESRTRLAAMISAIPDMVFTHRRDGEIISFHAPDPSRLPLPPEQLLNRSLIDIFSPELASRFAGAFDAAICSKTVQEVRYSFTQQGTEKIFEARIAVGSNEEVISIVRDITDRELDRKNRENYTAQLSDQLQLSESAVREREADLALAADAASLGFWRIDLQINQIFPSEQWCHQRGYSVQKSFASEAMINCVHPEDRVGLEHTLACVQHADPLFEHTYRVILPDAEVRWITSRGRIAYNTKGQRIMMRGLSVDVSARKRAELDLAQKQNEVTYLARLATMGELSGAFAHELNQPLTAILSNAQAARRYLSQGRLEKLDDIFNDIIVDNKRADDIIRRLRAMFEKNQKPHQTVNVNTMIEEVVRLLYSDLINHGIVVRTELASPAPLVLADRVQLQQVMINLLMNACDAMLDVTTQRNEILVSTSHSPQEQVYIRVIDHGEGIPTHILPNIFSPFFSTKEKGLGLGLSICRNIVESCGGQLWAENNLEYGANFNLRLPVLVTDDTR